MEGQIEQSNPTSAMEDQIDAFAKSNITPRTTPPRNSNIPLRVADGDNTNRKRKFGETSKEMNISELWEKLQDANSKLSEKIDGIQQSSDDTRNEIREVKNLCEGKIKELENQVEDVVGQLKSLTEENRYLKKQLRMQGDAILKNQEHLFDNYLMLKGLPEIKTNDAEETADVTKVEVDKILNAIGVAETCTSARRVGNNQPRKIKIYFLSQDVRHHVMQRKRDLPRSIYIDAVEPPQLFNAKTRLRHKRKILAEENIEGVIDYKSLTISYLGATTHWSEITLPPRASMEISSNE